MTHLRKLQPSDALLMLEWMHDDEVVHYMKADFKHKTIDDCKVFIASAQDESRNLHLAVTDGNNTYMGTVSLKEIKNGSAEFAIIMCKAAMGKGYAADGMRQILNYGFDNVGLKHIYWCVSHENYRALRFYDKNGYQRVSMKKLSEELGISESALENRSGYCPEEVNHYIWYLASRGMDDTEMNE